MAHSHSSTFDVFVSNIPLSSRNVKAFLNDAFSKYGTVERISVREKEHCLTAFVKFTEETAAKNAIVELNKTPFQGGRLNVFKGGKWGEKLSEQTSISPKSRRSYAYHMKEKSKKSDFVPKRSSECSGSLKPTGTIEVVVTHIESCWMFWAQPTDDENAQSMYNIAAGIRNYCTQNSVSVIEPDMNEVYGAIYEEDNCWYRCKVLDLSDNQCLIRFIDYGNSSIVDVSDLRKLPENLQWQVISYQFCLSGLSKPTDDNMETRALEVMKATLNDKVVTVDVVRETDSGCFEVLVKTEVDGDVVDVGEQFIKEGLTTRLAPSDAKTPESSDDSEDEMGSDEEVVTSASVATQPGKPNNAELQAYIKGGASTITPQSPVQVPLLFPTSPTSYTPRLSSPMSATPVLNGSVPEEAGQLDGVLTPKSTLSIAANFNKGSAINEVEHLKSELDRKNAELHQLKMRATSLDNDKKRLTKECSGLQFQIDKLRKEVTSVQPIQCKLQKGYSLLAELHDTRSKALSDPDWYQGLVHVINLLQKEDRVCLDELSSIDKLKDSLSKMEQFQNEIKLCSSKGIGLSDVETLVSSRNDARKQVLLCIDNFITQAQGKLRNSTRVDELQQFVGALRGSLEVYKPLKSADSGEVNLTEILQKVHGWQDEKKTELLSFSLNTDGKVAAFASALETLQKCFLSPVAIQIGREYPNLEKLVDDVIETSSEEMGILQKSTQARIPEDIAVYLLCVLDTVTSELQQTQMLQELFDQYSSLRVVTEECIGLHVDTNALQTAKRSVRDLRRQYGHKLVDRKEFSMDPLNESADELEIVDAQIVDIRQALHKAFAEEQRQSAFLAKYLDEFPELILLHPEFNLKQVKDCGGLLSPGRNLEHFEITGHIDSCDGQAYRSEFLGKPCVLKEYPLTNPASLDVIVSNAQCLNAIPTDDAVKIVCISPDWAKEKVLLQLTDYYDEDLSSFLSEPRNPSLLKAIFRKILKVLQCFHDGGFIYGDLQVTSVRLNVPKEEDDFDLIQVQIVDSNLAREKEMQYTGGTALGSARSFPSSANDMYNFGLLLLLAYLGQKEINHDKSGRPCLPVPPADPMLSSVLNGLLHLEPKLRLSPGTTLKHDFFST